LKGENNVVKLEEYLNQDIDQPKYLFHGSPYLLDKLSPRKSHDDENKSNEDLAIFLFPMFRKVTPYALRNAFSQKVDGIAKEDSYFSTTLKGKTYPFATIKNRIINQDEKGYVYVFLRDETMIKDNDSYQYRCYHELVPIDIIEVRFKDFVDDFEIIQDNEKIKHSNL
jgi:hypothetical protein